MIAATKRLMPQFSGMLLRHGYVWNVFGNRKVDTWGCGQIVGPNRSGKDGVGRCLWQARSQQRGC